MFEIPTQMTAGFALNGTRDKVLKPRQVPASLPIGSCRAPEVAQ